MSGSARAVTAVEELRYDVLPAWAWRRPMSAIERLEGKIAAMERLIRENDRALAESIVRLARLADRHRHNRDAFERRLAQHRTALAALREGSARP